MKRTLAIIVTVLMLLSLVPAFGESANWREPFPEPVQVKVAFPEVVDAVFAPGESMGDNLWTRLFKERFNVEVIADWVSIEYDTKLNLAIASNTLPDIFQCNAVQLNQLMAAGQIQDLTNAYETCASPSMVKMMERNWDIVETAMSDGKMFALPRLHYGFETLTSFIWARKDWMESNSITSIDSLEDFEGMMDAFMKNNGAKYGVMLDKTLLTFFQMSGSFHSYPKIWVDGPDGDIVYGATLPETKEMLARWAKWYQEGYIRPDFATLDSTAMLEDALNGYVGAYGQQNWACWSVGKDMIDNQGENSWFLPYNIPSIDGEKVMYPIEFANGVYNVVHKDFAYPEVLVKLVDCYIDVLDDSIGEGTMTIEEVLPFNTNSMHHVTGPFKVEFQHYNDIKEVSHAVMTGEEHFSTGNAYLFYNEIMTYVDGGDLNGMGRYIQMGFDHSSLYQALSHVDNGQILKTRIWGASPQVVLDYGTTLNDLLVEGYTQIIMGVEDIDYFDTLIETWWNAGGDQCTAAVNEMYGSK